MTKLNVTEGDGSFLSGSDSQTFNEDTAKTMFKVMSALKDKESTDIVSLTSKEIEIAINGFTDMLSACRDSNCKDEYFDALLCLATIHNWLTEQGVFNK